MTNRKQRTKIGNDYSTWREIPYGVPQGSILGPLLFNIFICGLFLITNYFETAHYDSDPTRYVYGKDVRSKSLQNGAEMVFTWFKTNQMKTNEDKCNIVLRTHQDMHVKICTPHIKKQLLGKVAGSKNWLWFELWGASKEYW